MFFDWHGCWPDEFYHLDRVDISQILENISDSYILACLVNENYFDIPLSGDSQEKIGEGGHMFFSSPTSK